MDVSALPDHATVVTKVNLRKVICINSGCTKSWNKFKKESMRRHKTKCSSTRSLKVVFAIPLDIWNAINVETQGKIRELVKYVQSRAGLEESFPVESVRGLPTVWQTHFFGMSDATPNLEEGNIETKHHITQPQTPKPKLHISNPKSQTPNLKPQIPTTRKTSNPKPRTPNPRFFLTNQPRG